MATVREFELDVDTGKAEKNVDDLAKSIDKLAESISDSNKETVEGLKDVEAVSKETAGGVKKIGGALKALGIGLIIAGFTKFVEVLNENQKVADFFSITFEALSLAFNDFFNFIDHIIAEVQLHQSLHVIESTESLNLVVLKTQLGQTLQLVDI